MVKITTVPFGYNSSAHEIWETPKEEIIHEHTYRSGKSTWKASALYCPRCSPVREKDTRNGGFKDKWSVNKEDYSFTLQYEEDESGIFAKCSKCGHDVRAHTPENDSYVSIIVREDGDGPPLPLLQIQDPHYEQGFFIFPFTEYERVRSEGTKAGGNILPTAEIEGVRYVISWNNFLTKMKAIPNVSVIGIPKTYFQTL
tara:strand:- start:4863 stop:5459 length:597 start_codon:yes stop_codon:yes gene_type:complete